jgi:hypothetical protein
VLRPFGREQVFHRLVCRHLMWTLGLLGHGELLNGS